jgi:hypothetical protein
MTLVCARGTAETLAEAGLLEAACGRFRLSIHELEAASMRQEVDENRRRRQTAQWLEALIGKLRDGIRQGHFEIIPLSPDAEAAPKGGRPDLPAERCLQALLQFTSAPGDAIWVDDRCVNAYLHREGVPIIGISDVLKVMVSRGALQPAEYYEVVHRLRAANVCFIPLQSDDVHYHLSQAVVADGDLRETCELAVLRRYIAACLLSGNMFQKLSTSQPSANPKGEVPFVVGIASAVADALIELWRDERCTEMERYARAQWLLDSLYTDHLGLFEAASLARPEQDDLYILGHSLAGLIGGAISLDWRRQNDGTPPRKRFMQWLWHHVLSPRFDAEPALMPAVADVVCSPKTGPGVMRVSVVG